MVDVIPVTVDSAVAASAARHAAVPTARVVEASMLDRRCCGLLAVLTGDIDLCLLAWEGLDLATEPDPLVDACTWPALPATGRSGVGLAAVGARCAAAPGRWVPLH